MNRREFITKSATAFIPILSFPYINFNRHKLFPFSEQTYSTHAIDLVREYIVVDMLNQVNYRPGELSGWLEHPETFTDADAKRLIDSGNDVFALGHAQETRQTSLDYFVAWNRFLSFHYSRLTRIDKPEDIIAVNRNGKSGILLTFQDSKHFETPDDVDLFYSLGQRLSQLTYNYKNRIGTGGFENEDAGLTDFGKKIVERMDSVGMMVDVSHCSDRTTLEAIEISSKPVIITHANCRALNPGHPRAKTDEMIKKMAAKGGVMGIAEIRFMVSDKEPVTVENFLDHYDYMIKLVGADHVGIGTDFDLDTDDGRIPVEERRKMFEDKGERTQKYRMHSNDQFLVGIEGINHPKRYFDIVEGFIRRKYSDETIRLILGENFVRAAREVWR
jgi:membrane dipeptidase